MHVSSASALIVTAVVASIFLCLGHTERIFSVIALVASAIEALIVFDVITFSMKPIRVDVVLPVVLVVAGLACWWRLSTRGQVTAATVVTLVGLMQLLTAVHVFR